MRIVEIKGSKIDLTDAIKDYAARKVEKLAPLLERFKPADMRIDLGRTTNHHQKGPVFRAEINLQIPGVLLRAEEVREDLYEAIDVTVNELKRQIVKHKETLLP